MRTTDPVGTAAENPGWNTRLNYWFTLYAEVEKVDVTVLSTNGTTVDRARDAVA